MAAINKGVDYIVDLTIFYGAFIALSLFWLHERTRDYALLIEKIEIVETNNEYLKRKLSKVTEEFDRYKDVERNHSRLFELERRLNDLQSNSNNLDKHLLKI